MYQTDFGYKLPNGLTIGFECEFFLLDNKKNLIVPDMIYPTDQFPLLVEARSEPSNNLHTAFLSLTTQIQLLTLQARSRKEKLHVSNWEPKSEKILKEVLKKYSEYNKKDEENYSNVNQLAISKKNEEFYSAGIHISLKKEATYKFGYNNDEKKWTTHEYKHAVMFDFLPFFQSFDEIFDGYIKNSERTPGFYSVKNDGRVEYRSLPTTLIKKANFLQLLEEALKNVK